MTSLVEIPRPSPEELEAMFQARREHQAKVMALLRQGLKYGPDYEDDWASWEEFVGELLSLVVGTDEREVMWAIFFLNGLNWDPLRAECWKIVVNDEENWRLADLEAALKAAQNPAPCPF